jgi:hypothetical protein
MRLKIPARSRRTGTDRSRFGPRKAGLVGFAMLLGAALLGAVAPAQALDPAGLGPRDPNVLGYPAFYTDDGGTALQMCDDGTANCLGATKATLNPPDGESFYWMATSTLAAGTELNLSVEFALEAAWLDGQRQTFDRLRVRGSAPDGNYTLTHPYGTTALTATGGEINFTADIGCEPAPGAPCDFTQAASAGRITQFLVSSVRPPGHLGDAGRELPATVGVGGPAATLSIDGPASASTSNFAVLGELAPANALSLPATVDFGNVRTARTRQIQVLNTGTQPRTLTTVGLTGAPPTLRIVPSTGACANGTVLPVRGRCTVAVRYTLDGRKSSAANLSLVSPVGTRTVPVAAKTSAVFTAPAQVQFAPQRSGTRGPTRRIVVRNTGSVPMRVRGVALRGANAGSFDLRPGAPRVCRRGATVPAGGACGLYAGFEPNGFGTRRASVVVRTNALTTTNTIRLLGRAT